MSGHRVNYERLHEASDEALAGAFAHWITRAHRAPKELAGDPPVIAGSGAWATFSAQAFRVKAEIDRRRAEIDRRRLADALETPGLPGYGLMNEPVSLIAANLLTPPASSAK